MGMQGNIFRFKGILSNDIKRLSDKYVAAGESKRTFEKNPARWQKQNDWFLAEVTL